MCEVRELESGCCFCCWFLVVVSKLHKHGALPGRIEVDRPRPHFKNKKKTKNGYSRCLRVKAGNEHSYPQHINCIFFCKTQIFLSICVFAFYG